MRNERYELELETDATIFEFTSVGPKGNIRKRVIYSKTSIENFYTLSFGDKDLVTGGIDSFVVTDNKDSQKVLSTVAFTIYTFLEEYPSAWVFLTGSTKARTRLYQIGISNNLAFITTDFTVLGRKEEGKWYPFEKNIEYDSFLITLKKNVKWKI